jgi:hypothetical protein
LQAALGGLETQRTRLDYQIAAVRSLLGNPSPKTNRKRRKYRMSAEGRARIIAATRKRWAAVKKVRSAGLKKAK